MSDNLLSQVGRVLRQASPGMTINMPYEQLAVIRRHMEADAKKIDDLESWMRFTAAIQPVDAIISDLEAKNLGWSLDHNGALIEARVWDWPNVIGRYRPHKIEPLAHMLLTAIKSITK
jgi:hypothetical protein